MVYRIVASGSVSLCRVLLGPHSQSIRFLYRLYRGLGFEGLRKLNGKGSLGYGFQYLEIGASSLQPESLN